MSPAQDYTLKVPHINPYQNNNSVFDHENLENFIVQFDKIRKNLVVFLGAGASIGASNVHGHPLPSALFLRNHLWSRFMLKPEQQASFDFGQLGIMSLEHASALVEANASRGAVIDEAKDLFKVNQSLWQHACLPFLNPKAVFTTNYDTLIEQGWHTFQTEQRYKVLYEIKRLDGSFTPLYKPHGSIEDAHEPVQKGGLVLTQFDYYDVLNERKQMLEQLFEDLEERYVLFIGYSFQDFDISSIIYDYAQRRNRRNWYAVFPRNDQKVQDMYLKYFNIRVIPLSFFEFMIHLDQQTRFLPAEATFANAPHHPNTSNLQGFATLSGT